jgi:hypothetical protein
LKIYPIYIANILIFIPKEQLKLGLSYCLAKNIEENINFKKYFKKIVINKFIYYKFAISSLKYCRVMKLAAMPSCLEGGDSGTNRMSTCTMVRLTAP